MNTKQTNQTHAIIFGAFTLLMAGALWYTSHTGWHLFNDDGSKNAWNSSGPGYHK